MLYGDAFLKLSYETAIIIFMKKDGNIRLMLGTRNISTANLKFESLGRGLGGHDTRCSINNGNMAVIDMVIGEARSFNMDRLVDIEFKGEITTLEQLDALYIEFEAFKNEYESENPMTLDMSML